MNFRKTLTLPPWLPILQKHHVGPESLKPEAKAALAKLYSSCCLHRPAHFWGKPQLLKRFTRREYFVLLESVGLH